MQFNHARGLASIVVASITVVPQVFADDKTSALPDEILACAAVPDVMLRLSCYDREVAALRETPVVVATMPVTVESAPAVAAIAAAVPVTAATPVAADVVAPEPDPESELVHAPMAAPVVATTPAPVAADAPPVAAQSTAAAARKPDNADNFGFDTPVTEISANVARIQERPYGEMVIYLDNGQVWEQKHVDRRFRLKIGESVTIGKGAMSGYRLSGNSNRSIQVERLK